jgi:nucleoside-diphosphate-sugar epimerase
MKVLFIGGSGTISSSCVVEALKEGFDVTVFNRDSSHRRKKVSGSHQLVGDISNIKETTRVLNSQKFDVIVNFLTYTAQDAEKMVELFSGKISQYIHISSASAYHKPVRKFPITESTPLKNPYLVYARDKIDTEDVFMKYFKSSDFPITIVRPSHTYDDSHPPLPGDWTTWKHIGSGNTMVVHGDGTSLWTVTHASDFAVGLVGLIGNTPAIGEEFHITGDEVTTWNDIYSSVARVQGISPRLVHLASESFKLVAPEWFWTDLYIGDLSHSAVFDNSKIHRFVPKFNPVVTWPEGVRRLQNWYSKNSEPLIEDTEMKELLVRFERAHKASNAAILASVKG